MYVCTFCVCPITVTWMLSGPMPGLLFWPPENQIDSDGPKRNWLGHRQSEVEAVLEKQMAADEKQGFHYIGYHGYAKRYGNNLPVWK